jgi:hypothetical protein
MTSGSAKEVLQMVRQGPPNPRDLKPVAQKTEESAMSLYNERLAALAKENIAELTEADLKGQAAKVKEKEAEKEKEVDIAEDNSFIYDDYGNKMRNIHGNRARRKKIESRCTPMEMSDLLMMNYVEQKVVLKPGKLEVVFRSVSSSDAMFAFSQIEKEKGSALMVAYKIGRLNLALSLVSINSQKFEPIKIDNKIDPVLFQAKYDKICAFPEDLLVDLITNYQWFTERVKELSVDDESIINF